MMPADLVLDWFVEAVKVPMITDWLMVIITIFYVGATIAIYRSNKDALRASEKLVDSSIAQVGILKEQIKASTNMQLFEMRVKVLKQLEQKKGFSEHESLLDILFSEEIVDAEKEIISLCLQRDLTLWYYYSISNTLGYKTYCNENFPKVKGAYITKFEIDSFIRGFENKSLSITVDTKPNIDPQKSQEIREQAFALTDDIERKIESFFSKAKNFIKETVN